MAKMKPQKQTSRPRLSIVIPAYRATTLARCLESARATTVECEIVVVDDASPDDLRSVVEPQAAADRRLRFVRNPSNLGIPANFNQSLRQARGRYICMLGDDDEFLPGNFEKKLALLDANADIGFVYSRWNGVDENGQVINGGSGLHAKLSYLGGRREFADLFTGNYINLATIVFRRRLFEEHGGFDEGIITLCDWDLFLRWAYHCKTAFLAEPLANVMSHQASDTNQRGIRQQQFARDKLQVWRKWLIEREPPLAIDEETWLRMAQFYNADLAHWFGEDASTINQYRQQFDELQRDYQDRMPRRYAQAAAQFSQLKPEGRARTGNRPKLSILVPAYNRPDMLSECLDSLASAPADCEILVVDDCSPTDLSATVARFSEQDPRISFVRNETNLGPTKNFNKAISLARGSCFCILGDDETVLPGNFEKKLAILDAHPEVGLVYSRHFYTDGANQNMGLALWPGMVHYSYIGGRDEFRDLLPWNYISLHSVVYRKALWERYGGFDEAITECGNDWEMNIRYSFYSQTAYIDEPLLNVRVHEGATTRRMGLLQEKLASGRIEVWRNWLVKRDEPIILDDRGWAHMYNLYVRDLNFWFQNRPDLVQKWLTEFDGLKREASAQASKHFVERVPWATTPVAQHPAPPTVQAVTAEGQQSAAPSPAGPTPTPVAWEGGFFETHSLALVNRELALAMLRTGEVDVSITLRELEPIKFDPRADPTLAPLVNRVGKALAGGPAVYIRHAWPPVFERPAAGKWVMVQPWEYGALPTDWVAPMRDQVDEIWAYSNAVRQMYIDSGVPGEKVFVVPCGIDRRHFRPGVKPVDLPTKKSVRFLFVGGTIWRKGIDLLLEAYTKTFRRTDDVCLVIKDMGQDSFYRGQTAAETISRLQADPLAPEILYVTGTLRDSEMASLYNACTALVHPYRGEGFGLPVAEAMACGLPVVVTRGGACDDFCSDITAYFVDATRVPISLQMETSGTPWVLSANVEALAEQMRAVFEAPGEARVRGTRACEWVHQNLSWEAAADKALARIRALGGSSSPSPTTSEQKIVISASDGKNAARAAFEQGKVAINNGDNQAGEEHLMRAVELDPDLASAWYLIGAARMNLGRTRDAIPAYEKAVALRPDVSDFHNGLGSALSMTEEGVQRSAECFQQAWRLDPNNVRAWLNWADVALLFGDWNAAQIAVEQVRRLAPNDEQLHWLEHDLANDKAVANAEIRPIPPAPELDRLAYRPLISVLVPIHDVPVTYFEELVESLLQQSYPNWELCAVDDASTDDQLKAYLREAQLKDSRIRVTFLSEGRRISGATNVALDMAEGEYVAFLDHDDLLDPEAFIYVAGALNDDPSLDVVYSDEDKLTLDGHYVEPHFKQGWSPQLLLSSMYIPHLLVIRRHVVQQAGGLRSEYDGAQDFDLALRVTELTQRIRHVPVMLYHWRRIPGSTAVSIDEKPYAFYAGQRAVTDALKRRGIDGTVDLGYYPCTYRVRMTLPPNPKVSVIIPTRDRADSLRRCITSVDGSRQDASVEYIVVDNGSVDPGARQLLQQIEAAPNGKVISYNEPFNYAAMNNLGARHASGDLLLFMHDDIQPAREGWLQALLEFGLFPGIGAVGCCLIFGSGEHRIQHAGMVLGLAGVAGNLHRGMPWAHTAILGPRRITNYSAVSFACGMVPRAAFDAIGGFDEAFAREFGDVDFCLRLRQAGLGIVYTPFATMIHHTALPWQISHTGPNDSPEAKLMVERWGDLIEDDPFFNPNIPRVSEDFTRWHSIHYPNIAPRVLELRRRVAIPS